MAVVACWTANCKLECLGELKWLLNVAINDQITTDKRDDAIIEAGLSVKGDNLVLNAGHFLEFTHDGLDSKELFSLVGHHWLLSVEDGKAQTVRIKCCVVVLDKLFANLIKRHSLN